VYRPLQFHERSQLFIGADDETFSVAIRGGNPDRSPLAILSETLGMTQFGDGWPQRSQLQPGAPSLGRCVTLLPVTFSSLCLGDPLSSCNKGIVFIVSALPFRVSVEQFHEARLVKITHRGLAIWLDPFGMLDAQVVVNLLPKLGVGVDFVKHRLRVG
jgi:hypothetical protein